MKIVNKTPHIINFVDENGETTKKISPDVISARVTSTSIIIGEIDGIQIEKTQFGEVEGLPEEEEGVYYIVSRLVANACQRTDLLVPGQQVRDKEGKIIGCRSLSR